MTLENIESKRKARKKTTAEDFTPPSLVNEILDRLTLDSNGSVWEESKTFCDPACGNGNFLIAILQRKLALKHNPLTALSTLYGADIMQDNTKECRLRLLKTLKEGVKKHSLPKPDSVKVIQILYRNIKWTDTSKYPNGSLDYNFEFKDNFSEDNAKKVIEKIKRENLLNQVKIS